LGNQEITAVNGSEAVFMRRCSMASEPRKRSLVVVQLSGANDALNTVIPYSNGLYYDFRPAVHVKAEQVLPIDDD
jgi:uncharacterized protein (DUF1501 family)